MITRPAAVSDLFYSAIPETLAKQVSEFIHLGDIPIISSKALIVPHAGFIYSGSTAGYAYAMLKQFASKIKKVVIVGPCHRVWLRGTAIPNDEYFATPFGKIPVDKESLSKIIALDQVSVSDIPHENEHSIEVQLPFLQKILFDFKIVPLVYGNIDENELAEVIETLWGGEETIIIVSSDLSHFLDYDSAVICDKKTSDAVENLMPELIESDMACGSIAIKAILNIAKRKNLSAKTLKLCNSGDTAGNKDRVVGYGAYAIY